VQLDREQCYSCLVRHDVGQQVVAKHTETPESV